MSVHQNRNGTWYDVHRIDGHQRSWHHCKGPEDKRLAEAHDFEIKAMKKRGERFDQPKKGIYLDELCQIWIDTKKSEGKGGSGWLKNWASNLNNNILRGLLVVPVDDLTSRIYLVL